MSDNAEVRNHIERPAPPWRRLSLTECGLPMAGHPVVSRDEFVRMVKSLGKQRASMQLCMTCWNTAERWADWATDPVQVIARETYSRNGRMRPEGQDYPTFLDELRALAALVEAHPDEFHGYLSGLNDTASLSDARARARFRRGRTARR